MIIVICNTIRLFISFLKLLQVLIHNKNDITVLVAFLTVNVGLQTGQWS